MIVHDKWILSPVVHCTW